MPDIPHSSFATLFSSICFNSPSSIYIIRYISTEHIHREPPPLRYLIFINRSMSTTCYPSNCKPGKGIIPTIYK